MNYEIVMLLFYFVYCATGLFAKYPVESLRLILAISIVIVSYFIFKYFFSLLSIHSLEKIIVKIGVYYNVISLLLYIVGIYQLGFNFYGYGARTFGVLLDKNIPRLTGFMSDPNLFAFSNILFFFYFLSNLNKKWCKLGAFLSLLTMSLTLSRGAILAIVIGLALLFLQIKLKSKIKLIITFPIIFIIFVSVIKALTKIDIIEIVTYRFSAISNDGGSGRFGIWQYGWDLFLQHPIIGIGIYNFLPYNQENGGMNYMHNTFLEVLTESGIIGFGLFILFLSLLFIKIVHVIKINKEGMFLLPTFVSIVSMMLSLSLINNVILFLFFTLVWRYENDWKLKSKFLEKERVVRKKRIKLKRIVW